MQINTSSPSEHLRVNSAEINNADVIEVGSSGFSCLLDERMGNIQVNSSNQYEDKPNVKQVLEAIYHGSLEELYAEPVEYWTQVTPLASKMLYSTPGEQFSNKVWTDIMNSPDPLKSFNALSGKNLEMPAKVVNDEKPQNFAASSVNDIVARSRELVTLQPSLGEIRDKPNAKEILEKLYNAPIEKLYAEPVEYWTQFTALASKLRYSDAGESLSAGQWDSLMASETFINDYNAATGKSLEFPHGIRQSSVTSVGSTEVATPDLAKFDYVEGKPTTKDLIELIYNGQLDQNMVKKDSFSAVTSHVAKILHNDQTEKLADDTWTLIMNSGDWLDSLNLLTGSKLEHFVFENDVFS